MIDAIVYIACAAIVYFGVRAMWRDLTAPLPVDLAFLAWAKQAFRNCTTKERRAEPDEAGRLD
jgi:hypothetical protein